MLRSDDLLPRARAILAAERERLRRRGVPGELVLVGGSSVPGALTRGDVDLHLRVAPEDMATAVAALREVYDVVHPEIWQPTLATFAVPGPEAAGLPTGVAVTPVGSEHDVRFTVTWRRIAADRALLAEYNRLKEHDAGGGTASGAVRDEAYEARKSAFFDRVVAGDRLSPP